MGILWVFYGPCEDRNSLAVSSTAELQGSGLSVSVPVAETAAELLEMDSMSEGVKVFGPAFITFTHPIPGCDGKGCSDEVARDWISLFLGDHFRRTVDSLRLSSNDNHFDIKPVVDTENGTAAFTFEWPQLVCDDARAYLVGIEQNYRDVSAVWKPPSQTVKNKSQSGCAVFLLAASCVATAACAVFAFLL